MAQTMVGVTPRGLEPEATTKAEPQQVQSNGDFQPFATSPGKLTGLSAWEGGPVVGNAEVRTSTQIGASNPSKNMPFGQSGTLLGFAAIPSEISDSPHTERGISPETARDANDDQSVAGVAGVTSIAQERPAPPEKAPTPNATLLGVSPIGRDLGSGASIVAGVTTSGPGSIVTPNATLLGLRPKMHEQEIDSRGNDGSGAGRAFKGTLLGVSPALAEPPHPTSSLTGGDRPNSNLFETPPATEGAPVRPAFGHATVLGMAPPIPSAAIQTSQPQQPVAAQVAIPPMHEHKGTLLGVAMPGIAPLQPGQQKEPQPRTNVTAALRPPKQTVAERPPGAGTDQTVEGRRLAWIFGSAAAVLFAVVFVALGLWWTSVHLSVEVTSSETGHERLAITCTNCPDGTRATIESSSTEFRRNTAMLDLPRRLTIGMNELSMSVARPGRPRSETVAVSVPVEFRVASSIAGLDGTPPCVSVLFESVPGTNFVVAGKSVVVDSTGKVNIPIDVSDSLLGQSSVVALFERKLDYLITRKDFRKQGVLVVRSGITPVEVITPGLTHVTDNATFTLSGRTSPQAKLTANGHAITVGSDGNFRQEMALSSPGATKLFVRAQESHQAPRLVEISIERVTNLRQRADELSKSLPSDFDSIVAIAEKKPDTLAALHVELIAIESVGASTRLVGTSTCERAPCLSSIRYGGPVEFRRGDRIIALGRARLAQRANSNERDLALEASLVMAEPRQ